MIATYFQLLRWTDVSLNLLDSSEPNLIRGKLTSCCQ